jgi:hypothetical protein
MNQRIGKLNSNFDDYIDYFFNSNNFTGPSIYFHNKTLAIQKRSNSIGETINSDEFFDFLYATLTAWGMHRMGPGNTKLVEIEELKKSFRSQAYAISKFEKMSIMDIHKVNIMNIADELWNILSNLKVSIASAQIVANSKALHHLLPSLLPPIDRTYTYNFFYNRNMLTLSEKEAFKEMYVRFYQIAITNKSKIESLIGSRWNTSETKTLDNAIVGYVLKELKIAE